MTDQKIDMYKLVEQVEKQKKMDIDDIFSNLDSVKNEEVRTEERQKTYVSSNDPAKVTRPRFPDDLGVYDTRFEAFRCIIEHVSYGTSNVNAYVEGHKDALEKYYADAYRNSKDLYVVEGRVSDELNRNNAHSQLYDKGYYDGLAYVLKALKRSKELLMAVISSQINKNL